VIKLTTEDTESTGVFGVKVKGLLTAEGTESTEFFWVKVKGFVTTEDTEGTEAFYPGSFSQCTLCSW